MTKIGAMGFNILDKVKEYSGNGHYEYLEGKNPKGLLGIMALSDNRTVAQKLTKKELIKRIY